MCRYHQVLNSITPPREYDAGGQAWVQYVSAAPATTSEVIALQRRFDQLLEKKQARETGICPVREHLYAQAMDELIRQETMVCAERGALFLRVRDESRMTVDSLQVAYQSSLAYGVRHAVECEQARWTMTEKLAELEDATDELTGELEELKGRLQGIVTARDEARQELAAKHAEEKAALLAEETELLEKLNEVMYGLDLKKRPPPPKEEGEKTEKKEE
eukprot:SAG25_NODE_968_length_4512_cov_3.055291_1_plen_218_part_00